MKIARLIFLLFLIPSVTLSAAEPAEQMTRANEAYRNKAYQEAIQQYEDLLQAGYRSDALYYNLGNAYFRNNQLGPAILHYEKALKVAPQDKDIKHNLTVARSRQQDQAIPIQDFFLIKWWKQARMALSDRSWSSIGIVLLWLGVAAWMFWIWSPVRKHKKIGFVAGIVLLALAVWPMLLAYSHLNYHQHSKQAILLNPSFELRSAPEEESKSLQTIHAGLKMSLLDSIGDWYKVQLPNGEEGWILKDEVGEI